MAQGTFRIPIHVDTASEQASRVWAEQVTRQVKQQQEYFRRNARITLSGSVDFNESPKSNRFRFNMPKIGNFHNTSNVQLSFSQKTLDELGDKLNAVKDDYIDEILRTVAEKTPVDTGRAKAGWVRVGDNIINPVPYVKYLELGTIKTRPVGMVSSTISASQRILDLVISRHLR